MTARTSVATAVASAGAAPAASEAQIAVRRLTLTEFRCYAALRLETDARPVVLTGPNGAGKTNIIEAISYLLPGRGLRRARLAEVGRAAGPAEAERPWAVAAAIDVAGQAMELGTGFRPDTGAGRDKRIVKIDGEAVRSQAALGRAMSAQWLTPQMDRLFVEGPSARRRFIDRLILGFDPDHAGPLAAYDHSLRSRSRMLRDGVRDPAWLAAVEESMAAHGVAVAVRRRDAIQRLTPFCSAPYGPFPGAEVALTGTLEDWLAEMPALAAEERMRATLAEAREIDARESAASVGPHRSDLAVRHTGNGAEAARCSTGEQKALLVALVLAAARLQARERGHMPLLLLDEIAAHLDRERLAALFDLIDALGAQAWMTGTDERLFAHWDARAQFFDVRDATVTPSAFA